MTEEEILRAAEEDFRYESEKRRFLYKDVEELIANDFLTHTLHLGGNSVVLRSSLPSDHFILGTLSGVDNYLYMQWFIAHHIYILNGMVISTDKKDNGAFGLYQGWLKDCPEEILEVLFFCIVGLRNRVQRAIRLTYAFCYENYSRSFWRMIGDHKDWSNCSVVSRLWRAFNYQEDLRVLDEREWEHTKVISGSMSKKAFDSINKFLNDSKSKDREKRQREVEGAVNWAFFGEKEEQESPTVKVNYGGQEHELPITTKGSDSAESMIAEMKKVMRGEKDLHDILVEEYHENIRKRREEEMARRRKILEDALERRADEEVTGGTVMTGYTKEQMEQLKLEGSKKTGQLYDAKEGFLYERFIQPKIVVGVLGKTGPEQADNSNTGKVSDNPKESLQDKIAKRSPELKKNK